MNLEALPAETRQFLATYRFDLELFEQLRRQLREGRLGEDANRIRGEVVAPSEAAWTPLPPLASPERASLAAVGRKEIAAGRVGVVVLNGGMATRFGGVVKGAVPVTDGCSFLELKLRDVLRSGGGRAWTFLMNSFATHDATRKLLGSLQHSAPLRAFTQSVLPRVDRDGSILTEEEGRPSLAATGHGDLVDALRASGVLDEFRRGGGRSLMMVNVDNLAATLDPAVIGQHVVAGGEMTVEVVEKDPGDAGGAPALVDGHVQIVESFRFPAGFDQDSIPVFNTNTFVLDARALEREFPLTWFAVGKKLADGRPAIQFERLAGELSAFLDTRYVLVPRRGPQSRFLPAKDPEELERRLPDIREVLAARGVL